MMIYITWFLWFALAELVIFFVHFLCRKKTVKKAVRIMAPILKFLGGTGLAVLVLGGPIFLRPIQFLMTAFYVALLGDAAADVVSFSIQKYKGNRFRLLRGVSLILGLAYFIFGTVNMQIVKPKYYEFTSDKLNSTHKFVFVSDVHAGGAQTMETTKETIQAIGRQNPDFVVLGGDITDDFTTLQETEEVYSFFGELDCPVYFVFGNHDRQRRAEYGDHMQYTEQTMEEIMIKNGITILKNDYISISDDLVILGREDASQKDLRNKKGTLECPDSDAYLVAFDHQPTGKKDIKSTNADLQLSGHTHAGQFFPLRFFYDLLGIDACGIYDYSGTTLVVSGGASGWRIPFRTEGSSCFEVVTLKPEN